MKKVAIIVGSESDKEQMDKGIEMLKQFDIQYDFKVLSAHRDPDALYSIVQMPKGIPVGCMAIGSSGAVNAAIYAVRIMALSDASLRGKLAKHRESLKAGK